MQNLLDKTETESPPSYTSCVANVAYNVTVPSVPSELDQFAQIVNGHEKLHFYAPTPMSFSRVPEVVQIRDSAEKPILSVILGPRIVSSGRYHVASSRQIMTSSGETLITASGVKV